MSLSPLLYLGIETSCDDTAVALYDANTHTVLAEKTAHQFETHQRFGGVVPELASRDHTSCISSVIEAVFEQSGASFKQLGGIAYTQGPGLIGSLLVGVTMAKALSLSADCPALGVHHIEGHIMSPFLTQPALAFPFLALVVSGGHTLLVHVQSAGHYQVLGQSLDDAVGEVFDKLAKHMGLGLPGGPHIESLAKEGNPTRFELPRPMLKKEGFDMSFSGLKTATLRAFEQAQTLGQNPKQLQQDISASFQQAVIDCLLARSQKAIAHTGVKQFVVCGGVSANQQIKTAFQTHIHDAKCIWPAMAFCGDNAAMIAFVGAHRLQSGQKDSSLSCQAKARWGLEALLPFLYTKKAV